MKKHTWFWHWRKRHLRKLIYLIALFYGIFIQDGVTYSYQNQFSNIVKLMQIVPLVPTTIRISPCLLLREVKWFIEVREGNKLKHFWYFWVKIYHPYSLKFLFMFQGTMYFSIIKIGGELTSLKNLCSGRVKTDKLDLREGK